jgi:alkylation response protein AidB-like acyl-CoA dehydrogenase
MDFKLTKEQIALRGEVFEVCKELEKKQPPYWTGVGAGEEERFTTDEGWEYHLYCTKEFARRGWISRPWPREYGGIEAPLIEQTFFNEARGYYGIPIDNLGVKMLAPSLIAIGTDKQKKEHLPPIANGDLMWCQLWSEPNAGSDLANVSTRAVRRGDEYVINGQKTWTTGAHRADWGFGLFRTDVEASKHKGLSFVMVDMRTPGVSVRPYYSLNMTHMYNDVFFDDVHVPVRNVIGEENKGWEVTRVFANFERSGVEGIMESKRHLDDLIEYCNTTEADGEPLAKNPIVRNKLAELVTEVEAARALSYRVIDLQTKGNLAAMDASAIKIFTSEMGLRIIYFGADLLGPYAQVQYSEWSPLKGLFEAAYQMGFAATIAMGTNEIQRNIIAWYGLGLPRMK